MSSTQGRSSNIRAAQHDWLATARGAVRDAQPRIWRGLNPAASDALLTAGMHDPKSGRSLATAARAQLQSSPRSTTPHDPACCSRPSAAGAGHPCGGALHMRSRQPAARSGRGRPGRRCASCSRPAAACSENSCSVRTPWLLLASILHLQFPVASNPPAESLHLHPGHVTWRSRCHMPGFCMHPRAFCPVAAQLSRLMTPAKCLARR